MNNPNIHLPWCDRAEHLADGGEQCRRVVVETEGVAAALFANGERIEVAIVNAAGRPMWFWPTPILARVADALAEAIRVRNSILAR